jgi:hypothetical protein
MTGPILFEITAADSHQQIILPVIRLLKKRGIPVMVYSDCELLRTASDPETLAREEIPFVRLAETPLPASQPEWEAAARPLFKLIPLEVERIRPALVVVLNDRNFPSNVYLESARRRNIPVLLIQESLRKDLYQRPPLAKLIVRWRRKIRFGIEEGLRRYGQGGCSAIAAWGETSRAYFRQVGVPQNKIAITGNPRFDQLADADFSAEARSIRAEWDYLADDFLLTFLSSPIERMQIISKGEKQAALGRVMDWARRLRDDPSWKNLRLAFKLHRAEDPLVMQSVLDAYSPSGWARIAEKPLYPLLRASQAALMFSTTAGVEAALLSVPVGILDLSRPLDDWDLVGRGVAAGIRSPADLAAFLQSVREDQQIGARGAKAASFFVANLGRAAEEVANLAARMVGYTGPSFSHLDEKK